ncbi:MAG: hypothetical protein ROM03_07260, partial [Mucispirillum sp.]|nr:hypothetical protein [Mucispirillum sp.]
LYAAPLQFSPAPDISSYLSDDFQNNILPKINPVADVYFKKAVKKYMQIYPSDGFILYQNKIDDKLSIKINKDYLAPNSTLSMQVYLIENQGEFSFVEIFFIESTGKISQVYSISGYVYTSLFDTDNKIFSYKPQWLYGTLALIYHDDSEYTDYDILTDKKSVRPASLIFIPDNKEYFSSINNIAEYPAVDVINKRNVLTFLVKDRRVLEYFNKYEVEPQGTFQKYLGGAVTMKAYIYAYSYSISSMADDKKKIEILSIPALFQLENDKGYNRSYAYQKSFYKSLSIKETSDYMRVLEKPNGKEITVIEKVYYRARDILYTPWNNETTGEDLWYAVILPKLNKTGYVISSQADVTEKGAR